MNNTMLIIDDLEMNRAILRVLFEKEFDLIEAECAEEALEILQACAGNIDIIILDVVMPGLSGIELLKKYRKESYLEGIPVVVITSSDKMEDQLEAFQAGANDFIVKPFMPEIVLTRVNNVMSSSCRMRDIQREKEALKIQSEIDQMTGLLNKTTAQMSIMNELALYPRGIHALMMIDIDNFKSVNDNEGHLMGDQTIKIIANQITSLFRKNDFMSRFGGDEFCVFMSNLPSMDIARKKAQELAILLKYKPNLTIPANVSVSIGLAFSNRESMTYDELIKCADEALYDAKEAGKARVYEYGQTIGRADTLEQDAILLVSRNRNVCSNVHAALGISNAVVECGTLDGLSKMGDILHEKIILSFIDLSAEEDDGTGLLNCISEKYPWIKEHPFICTYREGSLDQVKNALLAGTSDIISVPFDMKTLQRVVKKYIEDEYDETENVVIGGAHFPNP